jgi:hypothetical protein
VVQGRLNFLRTIYLSRFEPRNQLLGREVNVDHLIGFLQYTVGHPFLDFDAAIKNAGKM